MSLLQEQAVQMIGELSDDNVSFLIEIIKRLMSQRQFSQEINVMGNDEGMRAFYRLELARKEIQQYLPENFDPERELEEARAERYGSVG